MYKRQAVFCEAPITFTQAVLGAELEIPTIDGKVKYTKMCIRDRAEAGGYHPCGAEKRHDPHWLQRPGENVRGPCISNFCRYGRSLHRKGTPCGLAAGVPF